MSKGIAIFLCDITGTMGRPWVEAGYDVILVDPQHPEGVTTDRPEYPFWGRVTKVGHILNHQATWRILRDAIQSERVAFVGGFPPCTDVAVCGTKNFTHISSPNSAKRTIISNQPAFGLVTAFGFRLKIWSL